jgi:hypothetical protein
MEETFMTSNRTPKNKFVWYTRIAWLTILHVLDLVVDMIEHDWAIVKREGDLFFGTLLFLVGFLNVQSGKYCDGNTSDYLSCTRPTTYYYYNGFEVALIIIGVVFILLWFMKRRGK